MLSFNLLKPSVIIITLQVMRDYETFEEQVEGMKRKQAGFAKERMLHEKKVKKMQGEKDKKVGLKG